MNKTAISQVATPGFRFDTSAYFIAAVAIFAAIGLTIVSWLRLCADACLESHSYRLFGFTFEDVGIVFFPLLLLTHMLGRKIEILSFFTGCMLCSALGAEVMFIYLQKYVIGRWCPICLSIALSLAIAGFAYLYGFYHKSKSMIERKDRGLIMNNMFKGFAGTIAFVVGFILAFSGIGKHSELHAEEDAIKQQIAFGNPNSNMEVYIFTDWECPGCRSLESTWASTLPSILPKAKITFVDDPVHAATLNFTPYNLSFMVNNKSNYLALRRGLAELSENNKEPKDAQIAAIASANGTRFTELNYGDVAMANKYFGHLIRHFDVEGTPTVVIFNKQSKKSKKLEGTTEITQANIVKTLDTLSASH